MFEFRENILTSILSTYNRTEKSFLEDVQTVKAWIKTQPHLPEIMDDARIRNFLVLNKCSIELTKEKIDNYYTMRGLIPDLYLEVDAPEIKKAMEITYFVLLPKLTKDMCRVHITRLRKKERIDEMEPLPHIARAFHLQEIRLKEDYMFQDIAIFDMEGTTWSYAFKATPMLLLKCVTIYEKVYSNRLKAMYVINSFSLINSVLAVLKKLMKPKIFQRIHVCQGTEILHQIVPKDMIPKDYGGEEKSLEELSEQQNLKLAEHSNWLNHLNQMRVDEELRPEKLQNNDMLGFFGNFKQLDFD